MWLFVLFHRSEEILMTPQKKKKGPELVGPIIWNDYLYIMLIKCYQSNFLFILRISRMLYNTQGLVLTFLSRLVSLTLTFVWSGLVAYYKVDSSLVQRKA